MLKKNKIIYFKTDEEIEILRLNGILVSKVLAHVASIIKPGVTGLKLDKEAESLIRDNNADPGFKGLYGFPNTLNISINSAVVHGIPSKKPFELGDIISVDCGTKLHGFYGDSAHTFALGIIPDDHMRLLRATKTALNIGVENLRIGRRIGDLSFAIQSYLERTHSYGVVRQLVGHGLGRSLHEAPEVPNFGKKGTGPKIQEGLVVAIEPMVNLGTKDVFQADDEWTIVTSDGKPSAHYEYMVAATSKGPDILSDHTIVEKAIDANLNLLSISPL